MHSTTEISRILSHGAFAVCTSREGGFPWQSRLGLPTIVFAGKKILLPITSSFAWVRKQDFTIDESVSAGFLVGTWEKQSENVYRIIVDDIYDIESLLAEQKKSADNKQFIAPEGTIELNFFCCPTREIGESADIDEFLFSHVKKLSLLDLNIANLKMDFAALFRNLDTETFSREKDVDYMSMAPDVFIKVWARKLTLEKIQSLISNIPDTLNFGMTPQVLAYNGIIERYMAIREGEG